MTFGDAAQAVVGRTEHVDGRTLIESILHDVSAGNTGAATSLMAPDVRFRMPFAPPRMPQLIEGRAQVHCFLARLPSTFASLAATVTSAQPLAESGRWVFEYTSDGVVRSTRRAYRNTYVGLFTLDSSGLTEWTEYYNPIVLLHALGLD